jgi:hypothetical protein
VQREKLVLEKRSQPDKTVRLGDGAMLLTPPITEDYWQYRVRLTNKQAIVGFPKFGTIGIGFAVEEDWNTNLPYTSDAEEIYDHIKHNKGEIISKERCLEAISMIQAAVKE